MEVRPLDPTNHHSLAYLSHALRSGRYESIQGATVTLGFKTRRRAGWQASAYNFQVYVLSSMMVPQCGQAEG